MESKFLIRENGTRNGRKPFKSLGWPATEEKQNLVQSLVHGYTSSRAISINLLTSLKQIEYK